MRETEAATVERLIDWLGELGPRWGLPAEACRVHGWLYLTSRRAALPEIASAVRLSSEATVKALDWLGEYHLVESDPDGRWRTEGDPWELVVRVLERRRDRELGPALELLRSSRAEANDPQVSERIGSLLALAEDVASIDAQAQRFSPRTLRLLLGAGGRVARFVDSALGPARKAMR